MWMTQVIGAGGREGERERELVNQIDLDMS